MTPRWTAAMLTAAAHLALGWAVATAWLKPMPRAALPTSSPLIAARVLAGATSTPVAESPSPPQPPAAARWPTVAVVPLPIPTVTIDASDPPPPRTADQPRRDVSLAASSLIATDARSETTPALPTTLPTTAVATAIANAPPPSAMQAVASANESPASLPAEHRQCSERQTARHYPAMLRERGIQGLVRLRVKVDENGQAAEVLIAGGSGWRLLDEAARRVAASCPYLPARRGDQRMASWVEYPVRFALQPLPAGAFQ